MSKKQKLKMIVILFIVLMSALIYMKIKKANDETIQVAAQTASLFEMVDSSNFVKVNKYIVYGTHLNLEGEIAIPKISGITISNVILISRNLEGEERSINSTYNYSDGKLEFTTLGNINEGINLEEIEEDRYIFIKVVFSNGEAKMYPLKNSTKYSGTTYYTITKEGTNRKIDVEFGEYGKKSYLKLNVLKVDSLPSNVYDIVIDPGHGGRDVGATSKGRHEADIAVDCAKILKQKLEGMGYKVLLTRDGTEDPKKETAYNMYDNDGRVTIANESHAKLLISLHMNSNSAKLSKGGVEVYSPSKSNLDFAKALADNIVKKANTTYSSLKQYKQDEGVYVNNYNKLDIKIAKNKAIRNNYEPYNITTDTPNLYIIRETGGIATNAFVDGRNTVYAANKYVNSNVGVESYLIELGYMSIEKDLQNVLNNKENYMQAIADSVLEYGK